MDGLWKTLLLVLACLTSFLVTSSAQRNKNDVNRPRRQYGRNGEDYQQPCPDHLAKDDDLLGFDFIGKSGLDARGVMTPGVRKVQGSNRYQTAFGIDETADIRMPTRTLFPHGLPHQFSFVTTFRMTGSTPRERWSLVEVQDTSGEVQFAIVLDGERREIELTLLDYNNEPQTVRFSDVSADEISKMFDTSWHKLQFSSSFNTLDLYIDCVRVASVPAIQPQGYIDVNGEIQLGRKPNGRSATFDLQWLSLHCDPTKPERERCDEVVPPTRRPTSTLTPRTTTFRPTPTARPLTSTRTQTSTRGFEATTRDVCPIECPAGPVGPPGRPGSDGLRGPPGPPGPNGKNGNENANKEVVATPGPKGDRGPAGPPGPPGTAGPPGPAGPQGGRGPPGPPGQDSSDTGSNGAAEPGPPGKDGLPGLVGPVGAPGARGEPGETGPPGTAGYPGSPGLNGKDGKPGPPGPPGPPGAAGEGPSRQERGLSADDIRDLVGRMLQEKMDELSKKFQGPQGSPGVGKPGKPGNPGPQGIPGNPGQPGMPGDKGYSGQPGQPGPEGPPGKPGERGEKGDRGSAGPSVPGPKGIEGKPGPPGPPGYGRPGQSGDSGRPGEAGPPGPVGPPGQCNCAPASNGGDSAANLMDFLARMQARDRVKGN